jgi:hypothetical protein
MGPERKGKLVPNKAVREGQSNWDQGKLTRSRVTWAGWPGQGGQGWVVSAGPTRAGWLGAE